MNKVTKLSDLKTGMRVKVRNGLEYMVFNVSGEKMLIRFDKNDESGKEGIDNYNENMEHSYSRDWDIVKVSIPKDESYYLVKGLEDKYIKVLYEKEKYEYTQQEKDIVIGVLAMGFKYIGRGSDGTLGVFTDKPCLERLDCRAEYYWITCEGRALMIDKYLFENVKPATKEGKELVVLEDLLKEIEEQ